ncbi:hypothetical protein KY290_034104 [Solanum tuberosum]|uniref:Uncharacterized protein n=1 Tax=Solanum tuberosum TaxID=4113 RepID=A0ABQ7U423_SOLTU|nr:hypothetical protein KY289_033496 [Solanum tuberosum]KAH0741061.1 hypothetical protein KY290_034104 [Solanum tuberosum]
MGAKLTVIENRCNHAIEIRVWVPPARPDKFHSIIRIEGEGGWKEVNSKNFIHRDAMNILNDEDDDEEEFVSSTLLMIYIDGVYRGYYFIPIHLVKYANVICDINVDGLFVVQGIKPTFHFCRFK